MSRITRITGSLASFALLLGLAPAASADDDRAGRDARRAEMLEQWDADGDGRLSREERDDARAARREADLEAWDADGDGRLSRDEREAAREAGARLGRPGGRGGRPERGERGPRR